MEPEEKPDPAISKKLASNGRRLKMSALRLLPIPSFYDPQKVGEVWKLAYETRASLARTWAQEHALTPSGEDALRVNLLLVDVQNTFCIPGYELFVAGRSGRAAVEDNDRLCRFIYRNLSRITKITITMDTHQPIQIFHAIYLVDEAGNHPEAYTLVSVEDIQSGRWRFNPEIAETLGVDPQEAQANLLHYAGELQKSNKFQLTIWPYHAMLGGLGHALVAAVEEAVFFHSIARSSQPDIEIKGMNPFTEHYSVIGPEVARDASGKTIGGRNEKFIQKVREFDLTLIAGQAKSHCVAWTVADLLEEITRTAPGLAEKVFLLEDCTSPVVVPGMDFTEQADEAFASFAEAGMKIIRSTDPVESWYPD
jgi:nicotinamidase-related amidase